MLIPSVRSRQFFFHTLPNILFVVGFSCLGISFGPIIYDEVSYRYREYKNQQYLLSNTALDQGQDSPFSKLTSKNPIFLIPVNTAFSLVIEKIGVNVPVVANVPVSNKYEYIKALREGVAMASVSEYPSPNPGNTYIFAHSSLDFWSLGKYSRVFNLLGKLVTGDKIHVFYEGRDHVYKVVNKEVLSGWNTYPILRPVLEPLLTLQTCDPPGTTLNRLVITAKLVEVIEPK